MQVAFNGPTLAEAMSDGGVVEHAMKYFFSLKNRNLRVPLKVKALLKDVEKLNAIKWGIKVPHPEVIPMEKPEDEDGDVFEDDLKQIWPEQEDELIRLNIITPLRDEDKQQSELEEETNVAFSNLQQDRPAKKRKSQVNAVSTVPEPQPELDLHAVRTRSGQVRKEVTRLSYNHKDKASVAMLYYSN